MIITNILFVTFVAFVAFVNHTFAWCSNDYNYYYCIAAAKQNLVKRKEGEPRRARL